VDLNSLVKDYGLSLVGSNYLRSTKTGETYRNSLDIAGDEIESTAKLSNYGFELKAGSTKQAFQGCLAYLLKSKESRALNALHGASIGGVKISNLYNLLDIETKRGFFWVDISKGGILNWANADILELALAKLPPDDNKNKMTPRADWKRDNRGLCQIKYEPLENYVIQKNEQHIFELNLHKKPSWRDVEELSNKEIRERLTDYMKFMDYFFRNSESRDRHHQFMWDVLYSRPIQHEVLTGVQGTGKSNVVGNIMKYMVGKENYAKGKTAGLASRFDADVHLKQLFIWEEPKMNADMNARLKDYINVESSSRSCGFSTRHFGS